MTMKKASDYLHPGGKFSRKSISYNTREVQKKKDITEATIDHLVENGMYDGDRPRYRYQCPTTRPCPFVGCRYHLYLDVTNSGAIKFNFYPMEPHEITSSCALDVVDQHPEGMRYLHIGEHIRVTRERVRQIEKEALKKLAQHPEVLEYMGTKETDDE